MTQSPYSSGSNDSPTSPSGEGYYPATPPQYPGNASTPPAANPYPTYGGSDQPSYATGNTASSAPSYPTSPAATTEPTYPTSTPAYPTGATDSAHGAVPQYPAYSVAAPVYAPTQTPAPTQKSPVLGIVGFAVTLVAGIIFFVCVINGVSAMFNAFPAEFWDDVRAGTTTTDYSNISTQMSSTDMAAAGGWFSGVMITTLVGIVGFVLSIVATAQNKGRIFGIIGIIVGVLAPLSSFLAIGIAAAPFSA